MQLGDSLQVATALHLPNIREMHTLDGAGKRKRRLDLLTLNGNVAGAKLVIVQPYYIPPPEHLKGPVTTLKDAGQMTLKETDDGKETETLPQPPPVPRSTSGSTEDKAGTETTKKDAEG